MKKLISIFLAMLLLTMLTLPVFAVAEPFSVTVQPAGATYRLNEAAAELRTVFQFDFNSGAGIENMNVCWYTGPTSSFEDKTGGFGISFAYMDNYGDIETTFPPYTDSVGVTYYFAVLTYDEYTFDPGDGQVAERINKQVVSNPARIEVVAPKSEVSFAVRKTDDEGNWLSGALLTLTPDENYQHDLPTYEQTTQNGVAEFSALPGSYILSESRAPEGYNATDEKFYIMISENGVYLDYHTQNMKPYETITIVNKKIPTLNKDDHFAFMQGYPGGRFGPEQNMTRAEAVVMFARLLSESMDMDKNHRNNYYPDVNSATWYANEIGYMQTLGVLADYSRDGNFRPDDYVTRAEFATLAAHFDNLELTDTNNFSDVADNHWAVRYINSAAKKGWITGYPGGTFKPEANITRAEVVTLVGRILGRSADSEYLNSNASTLPRVYKDITSAHWAYLAVMEASTGHDYITEKDGEHWTAVYE